MSVTIQFLGAAGTVTGSTYLVSDGNTKVLVDCGLFQGDREWRERNWNAPQFSPQEISAIVLTHAHIDHIGMLPRYQKFGLQAPIFCSPATAELAELLLLDSGRLQEEEVSYRAKTGRSRHHPPLPLYTEADAQECVRRFRPIAIGTTMEVAPGISARWSPMGHILGACSLTLQIGGKRVVFSGDIGRYGEPVLLDPQPVEMGDLLLIESTYGDRLHDHSIDVRDTLADVINRTTKRGGVTLIPSFAVGRTQTLLYYLRELKSAKRIPDIPVIIDSPMASDATKIYQRHANEYDQQARELLARGLQPFQVPKMYFVRGRDESIALNTIQEPMVLISASGMLTGGRVLHHLRHRVSDRKNTVLFVGFQPPGSRGDWLKKGNRSLRLFGEEVSVGAEIAEISGLSAHGDRDELLRWCRSCTGTPGKVGVVHGEPDSAAAFAATLRSELRWQTFVPRYLETIEI